MKYEKVFRNYINNNLKKVPFPKNIYQEYTFQNTLDKIIDLLIKLLNIEVDDSDIKRVKGNFEKDIEDLIINFDIDADSAMSDIEKAGAHFEGFLKKIAYINPVNRPFWDDNIDPEIKGIKYTMLDDLLKGEILKKRHVSGIKRIPQALVRYDVETKDILDVVRSEVRNALHQAKEERNDTLLTIYRKAVLGIYLIAIDTNFRFLEVFDLIPYLKNVIARIEEDPTFPKKRYTDLEGEENVDILADNYADREIEEDISMYDEDDEYSEDNDFEDDETDINAEGDISYTPEREKRKGKISELRNSIPQMIIRGNPGMGKTTTLRYLALCDAQNQTIIPFLFYLKSYHSSKGGILSQIAQGNHFEKEWLEKYLSSGSGVLYLDGLNEIIDATEREYLKADIEKLVEKGINLVISSREKAYNTDRYNIPIFDLKPLETSQIIEYVSKAYGNNEIKVHNEGSIKIYSPESFVELLKKNIKLYALCQNPFFLRMYVDVIKHTQQFSENTGLLLRTFVKGSIQNGKTKGGLLNRESSKPDKAHWRENRAKYEALIQHLAYESRFQKTVAFSRMQALNIMAKPNQTYFASSVDLDRLIEDFKDLHLLEENEQQLSFVHELYQEYFAAEALINLYQDTPNLVTTLAAKSNWIEPLILFDGLLQNNVAVFRKISAVNSETAARMLVSSLSLQPAKRVINIVDAQKDAQIFVDAEVSAKGFRALLYLGEYSLITKIVKSVVKPDHNHKQIMEDIVQRCSTEQLFDFLYILRELKGNHKQLLKWAVNGIKEEIDIEQNPERIIDGLIIYWLDKITHEKLAINLFCRLKKQNIISSEIIIIKAIECNEFIAALELIEKYQLQEKYLIESLIEKAIKQKMFETALQFIEKYQLQEKFSKESLIEKVIEQKMFEKANELIEKYQLQSIYTTEFLIKRAIEDKIKQKKFSTAGHLAYKYSLQDKYLIEFLIEKNIEEGWIAIAIKLIEKYQLLSKYSIDFLIKKAFERNQLGVVLIITEKYQLQDKYPIELLVEKGFERNQFGFIKNLINKYELHEKFSGKYLIEKAIEANSLIYATEVLEMYNIEQDFIHIIIKKALENNSEKLARKIAIKYQLENEYPELFTQLKSKKHLLLEIGKTIVKCEIINIIKSHIIVKIEGDYRQGGIYIKELTRRAIYIPNIFEFKYQGHKFYIGQELKARVIGIDEKNRIHLSLK